MIGGRWRRDGSRRRAARRSSETAEDAAVVRAARAAATLAYAPVANVVWAHGAVGAAGQTDVHVGDAEHGLKGDA
jgi:hypothetical protein